MIFNPSLSLQQLLAALGADASKLNEWLQSAELPGVVDPNGERRVYLSALIRFVRQNRLPIQNPEALGLTIPEEIKDPIQRDQAFDRAFLKADWRTLAGMLLYLYMEGVTLGEIFDGPVRAAFYRVGELWKCDVNGIGIEHRATSSCLRALQQIEVLVEDPLPSPPRALGGALEGDPHMVPTNMAAAILAEQGFDALDFGPNTPADVLLQAARQQPTRLVWVSVGTTESTAQEIHRALADLALGLQKIGSQLVVGGVRLECERQIVPPQALFLSTMTELAQYAQELARLKPR